MLGHRQLLRLHAVGFAALIATVECVPALAQTDCSSLSGAEEVECLRRALAETQQALTRAERALQTTETAREGATGEQATLGAEQAARRTGDQPLGEQVSRVSALIVKSERVFPNQLQVHLENGQTWRQIQGDTQRVELSPNAPVSAEIWRSGFGGYRMRLPEIRRVLKVERIR